MASILLLLVGLSLATGLCAGYKARCSHSHPTNETPAIQPIKDTEILELSALSVLVY